ncbi:MAG: DUF4011 domain-containing protein, partial [Nocardiopsaceae bacterium]|nr:DUF4011 domain-containing protein [Nocardiopsaceae bacterium]
MLADAGDRSAADREAPIRSAISNWRIGLIDVTAANRLLRLTPGSTGLIEVTHPGADDIFARLRAGGTFTFRSRQPDAPGPHNLTTGMDPQALDAALRTLMRRADQHYLEHGLPCLYLAFGTLTWTDPDRARYTSPLLLVPARLAATEPRQPPGLELAAGDPVVNPALSLQLSRYRITLPAPDDLTEITPGRLLAEVRAAVPAAEGWLVSETVALSCFPRMKEAMYRDLLEHEDLAAAHPLVQALAESGLAVTGPAPDERIAGRNAGQDAGAAPPLPPVVLDADTSQRACITAALAGRSFTLDGPPGTGKSQTIANMIGALLHAGKTVLFVSEKAAALDAVAGRLTGAGLSGYLLELHSHRATRAEVAASLGKALEAPPAPPDAGSPAGIDAALPRGEQLTAYSEAMHRVRDPLGYSLHDVLAKIASLQALPAAPATGLAPAQLTAEVLGQIRRTATALAATSRPANQGRSFAWRGVTEQGPLDDRLYQAASALETLAEVARVNEALADTTGLTRPSDAHDLARLLDHLAAWPEGMPDEWLTGDALDAVDAAVAQVAAALTAIAARESQASETAGIAWLEIPQPDALPALDTGAMTALDPPCADASSLAPAEITRLAGEFAAAADRLEKWLDTVSGLANRLGLAAPATFTQANDLLTLGWLAGEPDRPERAWLSVPGYRAASNAAQILHDALRAVAQAEAEASAYFTADLLRHDVDGLAHRFANEYHGLGRLSADYRADKKAIAAFTREGITAEAAQEHLKLAAACKHAAEALTAAEINHAALLGPHYTGRATDFARLSRALTRAATAVRCARGQDLGRAAHYISRDAAADQAISGIAGQARQDLSSWQAVLAPPPAIAPRPELLSGTIAAAIGWLRAHVKPLHAASDFTTAVSEVVARPLTFGQARQLRTLREAADSAHAQLAERAPVFRDFCGQLYAGASTDITALREALAWARHLRTMITGGPGPLTPAHLSAAESAVATDGLAAAVDAWDEARTALLAAFSPDRRGELAAELDDYQAGDRLLETMFNDTTGRDEWHAYQAAHASLAAHGLAAAVESCLTERVEPAQIPQVIERALLQEWAEHQLRNDPALAPLRGMGTDPLVTGYQQLNRALAAAAAADIIRACNARRTGASTAEAAVIRQEAGKQDKHLPVRELLARAPHVAQAMKPCFIMPPAAVSQYLPAGLHFDVVIFDEASQISPADAIGAIYRGTALIVAGDRKQLPPSFRGGEPADGQPGLAGSPEGPDPVSVLDLAQESGAFWHLDLRWHYRSRHEALIAFSNSAFYQGRLAHLLAGDNGGPDAGVELLYHEPADRSGNAPGDPGEAARVAQRVIHHFDTRPDLSLGVVTFSEAHADAIETALATARQQRPDLDRRLASDRLRGFFVKTAQAAQGDERDVLIVSTGSGPDQNGQFTTDFGPLGKPGGWRRLNVAITRARYRTEIVTSIRAADIPGSGTADGLRHLRGYLSYAARGAAAAAWDA